jgi:PAT family beta-lactamase induction signal transducer AmpG
MLTLLLLGFSSGLPIALVAGSTLQAWMVAEKVDLNLISIFAAVQIPYSLKFLWAPLMDRFAFPFLGRRRGWIAVSQVGIGLALIGMAYTNPGEAPWLTGLLALLVGIFGASQDIVVDAYRTDVLEPSERGMGAAVAILGYRLAMLYSGAFALVLADHFSWREVYLLMAVTMSVGLVTTLFARNPENDESAPKTLKEAVVQPLLNFFQRRGALEILLFVLLYKMDAVMTQALVTPFLLELGFTRTDIGLVNKGFGLTATIVGSLVGGALMMRLKMFQSLLSFGIFQGVAGLSFFALSLLGKSYPSMVFAIAAENFCSGMGNAVYAAFLMSVCDRRFSASQYALLSSVMALTRILATLPAGALVKSLGWPTYFIISTLVALPSLLLLKRFNKWGIAHE